MKYVIFYFGVASHIIIFLHIYFYFSNPEDNEEVQSLWLKIKFQAVKENTQLQEILSTEQQLDLLSLPFLIE